MQGTVTRVCINIGGAAQQRTIHSVHSYTRKTAGGAVLQQVGYLVYVLSLMKILHSNRKSFIAPLTFQRMRSLTINLPWQSTPFFCKNGIPLTAQCCLVYIFSCFNSPLQNMLIYLYEASWKLYCLNLFYVLIWKKNYLALPSALLHLLSFIKWTYFKFICKQSSVNLKPIHHFLRKKIPMNAT